MRRRPNVLSRMKCSLSAALVVLAATVSMPAGAGQRVVDLGEVVADGAGEATSRVLRRAFEEELSRLEIGGGAERYLLSGALVHLDTVRRGDEMEVACVVSGTLRERRGGALRAVVRGRGRVLDRAPAHDEALRLALEAAVRGVVRRVPEALAR